MGVAKRGRVTPDDALAKRRAMHAATDPSDVLFADVSERLAIRDPPGVWTAQQHPRAVRLFHGEGEHVVSRYVWFWRDTDAVIDHLAARLPQLAKAARAK